MTMNFQSHNCEKIREYIDSYVSGELLVETTQEILSHLEGCSECVALVEDRRRVRSFLRGAVERQPVPADLEQRVMSAIRRQSPGGLGTSVWRMSRVATIAAAVLVVVTASLLVIRWRNHVSGSVTVFSQQGLALLNIGLQDHIGCAIEHGFKDRQSTPEQMITALGVKYSGLLAVVQSKTPAGYSLNVGHRCLINGRTYVHFILRKGDSVVSIVLTERAESESFAQTTEGAKSPDQTIYSSQLGPYEVASFQTPKYLAFVISDAGEPNTVRLASDLSASIRAFLVGIDG
ncbi:MAG TPA: zf-HC2 domain-containing protein [Blastocatellia bacterium]